MKPIADADIPQRLDRIERNGRLWKSACLALVCAIAMVWSDGKRLAGKTSWETQSLVIRDQEGRVRIQLSTEEYGDAGLKLISNDGAELANLSSSPDGSSMLSLSSDNRLRMSLAAISDGSASFNFYDDQRTIANSLYYRSSGQGGLAMRSIDTVPYMNAIALRRLASGTENTASTL